MSKFGKPAPESSKNDDNDDEVMSGINNVSDLRLRIMVGMVCVMVYLAFFCLHFGLLGRLDWNIVISEAISICSWMALGVAIRRYMHPTTYGQDAAEAAQDSKQLDGGQIQQSKELGKNEVQVEDVDDDSTCPC